MTAAPTIKVVAFDFGGVIVKWDRSALLRPFFDSESAMNQFFEEVLTLEVNLRCDLSVPLAEVVAPLIEQHPHHRLPLEAWRDRWIETLPHEIPGIAELINDCRNAGLTLAGLSNISAETFPQVRETYEVFDSLDHIVISGEHHVAKPDFGIYQILCEQVGHTPTEVIFFDDSQTNIDAATAFGMHAMLFTSADQARFDLIQAGVLPG